MLINYCEILTKVIDYCLGLNKKDTRKTKPYFVRLANRDIINYEPCLNSKNIDSLYCDKHQYMIKFTPEKIKSIIDNKGKYCDRCYLWHFDDRIRCVNCYNKNYKNHVKKVILNKCKGIGQNGSQCTNGKINNTMFCDNHIHLIGLSDIQLNQLRKCSDCRSYRWWKDTQRKICDKCRLRSIINRKKYRMQVKHCVGIIKGNGVHKACVFEANGNGYCGKHQRQLWKYEMEKDNIVKVCYNYVRGCNTLLYINYHQLYCKPCRSQNSIYDTRRYNKYERKYYIYQLNARASQRDFKLSLEECIKLFDDKCHYCGIEPHFCEIIKRARLNGIDRVDNDKEYIISNCVTACALCNMTKRLLDKNVFIDMCEHILTNLGILQGQRHDEIFGDHFATSYSKKLRQITTREIEFQITEDQFNFISNFPCYLCGKLNSVSHKNGIDRLDNNKGYLIDNCLACCAECNWLKHVNNVNDLINMMIKITKIHRPILDSNGNNIREYKQIPLIEVPDYIFMMG